MADEYDILEAHDENMDCRKMKQIHELVKYIHIVIYYLASRCQASN